MTDDKQIRQNIKLFYEPVEMPGGYQFNQVNTLKRIDLYYYGKFESGETDKQGFKKFFYNISKPACDIATKFIDLDTKDIILTSQLPDQEWKVWLMMHDLKQWLKENNFGELLNEIGDHYPKYGHIFLKKHSGDKWKLVNLHNLRFDPASPSFDTDLFFYEIHLMSRPEVERLNENENFKKRLAADKQTNLFTIYECYDRLPTGKWQRSYRADLFDYRKDSGIVKGTEAIINQTSLEFLPANILKKEEVDDIKSIYRELKFESVPGRRLGLGFVEYLFDNQIAENEAENLERKGLYWTSLHIFQTRDQTIGNNLLTEAENGDILKVNGELNPVATEERNLAAYNATRARWQQNAERKTFSFDIARGENLPSRTPLGVANLQAGLVASYFDLKREKLGIFIKNLILEEVLPSFKKDKKSKHNLAILSSAAGVEKFIRAIAKITVDQAAFDYAMGKGNGFFPDQVARQAEEERLYREYKNKKTISVDIPDRFYDDAQFTMDIITTGEQLDVTAINQTLQVALQLVASNPAIVQNPATRTIFLKLLELSGVSGIDLNIIADQAEAVSPEVTGMPLPQGGSVSLPPEATQIRTRERRTAI